ncbi:hypothetical protein BD410DRAFT_709709, partial [Rickenella mellea]
KNGFTILSNVSGPERKQMAKLLLGIMAGAAPKDVIRCCRALLDFTFIAQYASHSEETLKYLDDALQTFHQHKEIFVTLGIREHFKIPKLHSLLHFSSSIRLFGSTDNYNTEMFERLHIDFAKDAYRASNHRDERPQMLQWLERREKIDAFDGYLQWKNASERGNHSTPKTKDGRPFLLAKHCPFPNQSISDIEESHESPWFSYYLKSYLRQCGAEAHPQGGRRRPLQDIDLAFDRVNVWTYIRMRHADIQGLDMETSRVGRVRIIFTLPTSFTNFVKHAPTEHLVYVEWFTRPCSEPDEASLLYEVKKQRETGTGEIVGEIIKLTDIRHSIQLFPKCGSKPINKAWTSATVLDQCESFYINNMGSLRTYQSVY